MIYGKRFVVLICDLSWEIPDMRKGMKVTILLFSIDFISMIITRTLTDPFNLEFEMKID